MRLILPYGTRRPWRTRKVIVRAFLLGVVLIISVAGLYWHRKIISAVSFHYDQWQCMRFSRPADQVAFEEDLNAGKSLAANDSGYHRIELGAYSEVPFYGYRFQPLNAVTTAGGQADDGRTVGSQ